MGLDTRLDVELAMGLNMALDMLLDTVLVWGWDGHKAGTGHRLCMGWPWTDMGLVLGVPLQMGLG